MSETELADHLTLSRAQYVRRRAGLGGGPAEVAAQVADGQFAQFFPDGRPAEGHHLFVGRDGVGDRIGRLWVFREETPAGPSAFIYDVEVDEVRRGQGWGRAIMTYAEQWARVRGANRTALNVFGGNVVARGLYRSLGFTEGSVAMVKDLR